MLTSVDYLPPPTWPPPADWPLPNDDWKPPRGWTPNRQAFAISSDGEYYLIPRPPGESPPERHEPPDQEQAVLNRQVAERMLALWARTVMANAHSYYQAALKAAWTHRAIEYGEEWSPESWQLRQALDQVWVRGYFLVMAAYQMERWIQASDPNEDEHGEAVEHLEALRHSLEHLDGANFHNDSARRSSRHRAYSIDRLPGHELFLGFSADFMDDAFGVVNLKEITERARLYVTPYQPNDEDFPDYVATFGWGNDEDEGEDDDR